MSTPARNDLDIWIGNSNLLAFEFESSNTVTTTPYPLAGLRVNFTVFNGPDQLVLKTTDGATPTITVTGNRIDLVLTPDDTRTIAGADYAAGVRPTYEIEFWDGTYETTWMWGNLKLKGGSNIDE